jgi:hypothetical protein
MPTRFIQQYCHRPAAILLSYQRQNRLEVDGTYSTPRKEDSLSGLHVNGTEDRAFCILPT